MGKIYYFIFGIKSFYIYRTKIIIPNVVLLFTPHHRMPKQNAFSLPLNNKRRSLSHLLHTVRSPWSILIPESQFELNKINSFLKRTYASFLTFSSNITNKIKITCIIYINSWSHYTELKHEQSWTETREFSLNRN